MRKSELYQFEYLRCEEDVFFVGLKGPRGAIRSFAFTAAEMTRLMEAYVVSRGVSSLPAREEVKDPGFVGVPVTHVIAKRLGISVEQAAKWWEHKLTEAPEPTELTERVEPVEVAEMAETEAVPGRSRDEVRASWPASGDRGSDQGGDAVRLADAAAVWDARRRVALVERLAELEVQTDAVAQAAFQVVTGGLPAVVDAVRSAWGTSRPPADPDNSTGDLEVDVDGVVLERLVRAYPQRARRILDGMADPVADTAPEVGG